MLRKREIELIVGLVEGTLEDETEARALLERSSEARTEFEAQSSVQRALRAAEPASMTEAESATIRREIWTEMRTDAIPTSKSTPWVYRLAPVAAALVLVVGVLAVLNRGFQDADETARTFSDAAADQSADTTQAATSGGLESLGDDDAAAPAAEGDGGSDMAEELSAPEPLPDEVFFETIAELVRSDALTSATRLQLFFADETLPRDMSACLESSDLVSYRLLGRATNVDEGDQASPVDYLVLVPETVEIGPDTEVTFVRLPDCEVVHVEE